MRLFAKFAISLGLILCVNSVSLGGDQDPVHSLYDIVAVGRGRGQILLATLAAPADKLSWRIRRIPVYPSDSTVQEVALSTTGTKALVVFSNGTARILDLTERVTGIDASDTFTPQHRLANQVFPYTSMGRVCLLDDLGHLDESKCRKAAAAAVHEDGRVLYALDDGRLVVSNPSSGDQEELPYRLPRGAQFQLLAGHTGDKRDFLVLISGSSAGRGPTNPPHVTEIIDPKQPATPLGQFADMNVAELRSQLEFSTANLTAPGEIRVGQESATTLTILAAHLVEQFPVGELEWSFYRVAVNPELYAPVLEFAPGEPDYPSDVDIWQEIKPLAHGTSRQAYEDAYRSLGDGRWSRCTSYMRTVSYPGTWLIEYWFYYPFDEGKAHPHIHDSEHLFVEVDKLGGTVRGVFASDHDSFVPNNLYTTIVKDAAPIALPLFATVELGKHAMAPDLNHDGRFTRGADDNLHGESYAFWGLRDRSSKFHFLMEPYLASMSLPRYRDGRFALAKAHGFFPDLDVPADHQVCTLRPFPDDPPCLHCEAATAEAATAQLVDHPDARNPEAIYKPYVVPWREVRIGVGIFDWTEGRGELSLAYAGDFRHMTGGLLPIPARLAVEYGWRPYGREVVLPIGGEKQFVFSRSTMYAGVRVERLITNTQGFYAAVTPKWVDISERAINGVVSPSDLHWQYGGVSYHAGYVLELPSAHKGNLIQHIGALIDSVPGFPVLFEWRVSLGFLRSRGRHDFDARLGDRNPYQ